MHCFSYSFELLTICFFLTAHLWVTKIHLTIFMKAILDLYKDTSGQRGG